MANHSFFDIAAFSGVKPSLDASLGDVSVNLERFLAEPTGYPTALEEMRRELRRVSSVLKMVHLDGLVMFCTELENVLHEIITQPEIISALHRDVLRRSLLGLTHYLDSLSRGAENVTLRLFPHYQELQQLRGLEMGISRTLF